MAPRISLVHATYHRAGGPLAVRDGWLESAVDPGSIEYVVGIDADDDEAIAGSEGCRRAIGPPSEHVTAVRNWNAAAALARGDLLVVVADDLLPPEGWDAQLGQLVAVLDPVHLAYAVKVRDSPDPRETLLRHPIVSRRFYDRLGLFDPRFHGVFCDDDISIRALWNAGIVDGRSLVLDHHHPTTSDVPRTASHGRLNVSAEYHHGSATLARLWSTRQRLSPVSLIPAPTEPIDARGWEARCRRHRRRASAGFPRRWVAHVVARRLRSTPRGKALLRRMGAR